MEISWEASWVYRLIAFDSLFLEKGRKGGKEGKFSGLLLGAMGVDDFLGMGFVTCSNFTSFLVLKLSSWIHFDNHPSILVNM